MNTEAINKMKNLMVFSASAGNFWANFDKATDYPKCDKFSAKFGNDSSFFVFRFESSLTFNAYTGYYGDSNCSKFGGKFDEVLIKKYMPMAMNALKRDLFEQMSVFAKADANAISDKAEKEIEALQKTLSKARGLPETEPEAA